MFNESALVSTFSISSLLRCLFSIFLQERTKKMLLEYDIQLEDFGGDIQAVPISALKVYSNSFDYSLGNWLFDK
jgi:hypothetical protein